MHIDDHLNWISNICKEAEVILEEWKKEESLQIPILTQMVLARLNLDFKKNKDVDLHIRSFLKEHPKYWVSRGAKGGVQKMEMHLKKVNAKEAKNAAKNDIEKEIEAKLGTLTKVEINV